MIKQTRQAIQHFFMLSKSEQRGTISLIILILIILAGYYLLPLAFKTEQRDNQEFEKEINSFREAQQEIHDSVRIEILQNSGALDRELANQKIKPFFFDPNKLPVEAWKQLGLTDRQIKSIKNYEAKGGKFRRKKDLKKMYAISEVEYEILEPYIRIISHFKTKSTREVEIERRNNAYFSLIEINKADSALIVKRLKLAPWIAGRIIKYRNLLGGYYQKQQLAEVYGFDSIALARRSNAIRVNTDYVQKLDLNKATFKQLVRHPYISYKLTQYIVNTRKTKGQYKSIDEIQESPLVSEALFYKLGPYLVIGE